jgi:hypothetical protein
VVKAGGTMGIGQVLRGVPERVRSEVVLRLRENGGSPSSDGGRDGKALLAEAIFAVEDRIESELAAKGVGPRDKRMGVVRLLNARRNGLLDELGENEMGNRFWALHGDGRCTCHR